MRRTWRWYGIAMVMLILALLIPMQLGCGGGGGGKISTPTGSIAAGTSTALAEQTIGTSGGTIKVNDSQSPLNGLQMDIPGGAYTDSRVFKISCATIVKHTFGSKLNPISPLITIENGGGYADDVMTITIPVTISDGQFAMAFYYDGQKGKLEGVPLISENSTSVTISTMHCSKFVISSIAESLLLGTIDSGFRPGTDDWQFPNQGSYIEPGGHCAGQSLTAMWYYCERAANGEARLYGRYDNNGGTKTPALWEDDSLGYRFASVVHSDIAWDSLSAKIFRKYLAGYSDNLTWKAFSYAIQLTGEPQYVGVKNTAVGGSHAMVVYKVTDGALHVADPNYPGKTDRVIEFVNGSFKPYSSGANAAAIAAGSGKSYDRIIYVAKTALINWGQIASRWGEFDSRTIGNDKFPAYSLQVVESSSVTYPLEDGFNTDGKMLTVGIDSGFTSGFYAYREGVRVDSNSVIELKPKNNELGFYILGQVGGDWEWVDFKYINVYYEAGDTEPTPTPTKDHPVINSISGPTAISCTAYPGPTMHYSIDVSGGTAPYYVTWKAGSKILKEGSGLTSVDIPCGDLRDNGEGYWIWIEVKDSKGNYAEWKDDVGFVKTEFTYGVKYYPVKYQVVTEPPSFPYESP
jgi:hypothetical protein